MKRFCNDSCAFYVLPRALIRVLKTVHVEWKVIDATLSYKSALFGKSISALSLLIHRTRHDRVDAFSRKSLSFKRTDSLDAKRHQRASERHVPAMTSHIQVKGT